MKNLFIIVALTLTAAAGSAAPIATADLPKYAQAVTIAIDARPLTCVVDPATTGLPLENLKTFFLQATSGNLNNNGAQPVLSFDLDFGDGTIEHAEVTTSADFQSIVAITLESNTCTTATRKVNEGTILDPKIVDKMYTTCVRDAKATCK